MDKYEVILWLLYKIFIYLLRVNIKIIRSVVWDVLVGQIVPYMLESFIMTKWMVRVKLFGRMVLFIMVNGKMD